MFLRSRESLQHGNGKRLAILVIPVIIRIDGLDADCVEVGRLPRLELGSAGQSALYRNSQLLECGDWSPLWDFLTEQSPSPKFNFWSAETGLRFGIF